VRAATPVGSQEELLKALEYPPYELPLEMWKERPARDNAPRRLARTKHAHGGVWVVHSVYLEKDTMNRDRSYFSHLLHVPAAVDPAAVLESWAADGWKTEYPGGATKNLSVGKLPVGAAISQASLTAFLAGRVGGSAAVSVTVCPPRLRDSADARRELVARFLKAVVLREAEQEDERRDRVFVHAEPGLVAMLLYAAVRILPPAFTADLTFSTFEPAHRGIRDFKLATVVGTYLGAPGKGLDPDLARMYGFGLDTIVPARSSPELAPAAGLPAGIPDLLELAASGEWDLLGDVHRLVGTESGALARVKAAVPLARAVSNLKADQLTSDDLIALKGDRRGSVILTQRSEKVWAYLRDAVLTDERLRTEFRDWLAEPARLSEYRREASEALVRGDLQGWDARWAVVRDAAGPEELRTQAEKTQRSLDKHLPTLSPAARDRLRTACAEGGVWPDHHLLAPTSPAELETLLSSTTPAEWQGYACFTVMSPDEKNWLVEATRPYRSVMRERVRRYLVTAPSAVLAGYLDQAKPFVTSDPVFLYDLLRPHRPECVPFLSRLIDAGAAKIDAIDWTRLLGELDVYGARTKHWSGFLLKNDHLAKLLTGFKADPAATPVWNDYLNLLGPDLLDGDEWETTVYTQLAKARSALGAAGVPVKSVLPAGGAAKLNAIDTVLGVMAEPNTAESLGDGELERAFAFFGINALDGLKKIYRRGKFAAIDPGRNPAALAPFFTAFRACYPVTHDYETARIAVAQWLALSDACPAETRAEFQVLFVKDCVPAQWHRDILAEARRVPFLPAAEARIGEWVTAMEAKKAGERYDRSTATRESDAAEDATYASPATKRARKTKSKGPRRREKGGISPVVWIVIGVALTAALVVGVIVFKKVL
jgi:hypothetical protein